MRATNTKTATVHAAPAEHHRRAAAQWARTRRDRVRRHVLILKVQRARVLLVVLRHSNRHQPCRVLRHDGAQLGR